MKSSFVKIRLLAICLSSLALCLHPQQSEAASVIWNDNGINWGGPDSTTSAYYRPGVSSGTADAYDGLPNDSGQTTPLWAISSGTGSSTLNAANNILNISTTGSEVRYYSQTTNWNASTAATVEFTIRINSMSGSDYAGSFMLGNSTEYIPVTLGIDGNGDLKIQGTSVTGASASNFNTIRFTLSGMDSPTTSALNIYVNNSTSPFKTITALSAATTINFLRFGDISSSATQGGSMDWQSVKWLSGSAIAPVPEPSTTALVLGALCFGGWRLRSRFLRA